MTITPKIPTLSRPTDNAQCVGVLDVLASSLAIRNGMVSGYLDVHIGAGNPAFRWSITYQQDGYDENGFAKKGGSVQANGPTLMDAVNDLLTKLNSRP